MIFYILNFFFRAEEQNENLQVHQEEAVFSRESSELNHLEIHCKCSSHLHVSMFGLKIISNIRNLEFYSRIDGYLKSCKGKKLENDEQRETTLYHSTVKFEDDVEDLTIKVL